MSAPRRVEVRSPGRVNLIGEHTDYNDGFALPLAIEPAVRLVAERTDEPRVVMTSEEVDGRVEVDLVAGPQRVDGWGAYVHGVLGVLAGDGHELVGWRGRLSSTLPVGASLSSSAALELAVARAAVALAGGGGGWDPTAMARVGTRAENDWVGVATGVLDQMACAHGVAGHALLLDCRDLTTTPVALPDEVVVVVLDTTTRRELVGSEYDRRREDCEAAAAALGVASLRDVTPARLAASDLDGRLLARARHVVTEDERTLAVAEALPRGDLDAVGRAMVASHASLRDDYEVSCDELDAIVAAALDAPGVVGARMTGGGFGGAAVALVHREQVDAFTTSVAAAYRTATGLDADVVVTGATDGTAVVGPAD